MDRLSLEQVVVRLAVFATFLLLIVGGTVNPTGSSLACPEPTLICHGQFFPKMTGGVLYEHGHRLFAMSVGLIQILLTVLLWVRRPALRGVGVLALAMVCAQGGLGAVTVYMKLPWLVSTGHLLLAFAYLALLLYIADQLRPEPMPWSGSVLAARRLLPWVVVPGLLLLAQIVLGGLVRHHEAALASIDLQPFVSSEVLEHGTPLALRLHLLHRAGGILVGTVLIVAGIWIGFGARNWPEIQRKALFLPLLVLAQIGLGLWVILSMRQVPVAVAHFAGATLLWVLVCSIGWQLRRAVR